MKKKLVVLNSDDITKENIMEISKILENVDCEDYVTERSEEFEEVLNASKELVEEFQKDSIEELILNFFSIRNNFYEVLKKEVKTKDEFEDICNEISELAEEIQQLQADNEVEDRSDMIDDFIDKLNDYQDTYGGLGKLYVELQ